MKQLDGLRQAFPKLYNSFKVEDTHKFRDVNFPERRLSPDVTLYWLLTVLISGRPNFRSAQVIGEFKGDMAKPLPTGFEQQVPQPPKAYSNQNAESSAHSASILLPRAQTPDDTKVLKELVGQLTSYMAAWQVSQHRLHMFSFLVTGSFVQLLRWDRAGAIASEKFDYVKQPTLILDFFHRLALMTEQEIGWDTTVSNAETSEIERYNKKKYRLAPENVDLVKFEIHLPGQGKQYVVACAKADFMSRAILGRGTRGHHGVLLGPNEEEDRAVYLKDTWNDVGGEEEHLIYQTLKAAGVPNLLECYGGGNVQDHTGLKHATLTQKYAKEGQKIHERHHYRIILEPAVPVVDFKDPYELITVLGDVLDGESDHFCLASQFSFPALCLAHDGACKAGYLHRDISVGNIFIAEASEGALQSVGRGRLADWGMAKSLTDNVARREHVSVSLSISLIFPPAYTIPGYLAIHVSTAAGKQNCPS